MLFKYIDLLPYLGIFLLLLIIILIKTKSNKKQVGLKLLTPTIKKGEYLIDYPDKKFLSKDKLVVYISINLVFEKNVEDYFDHISVMFEHNANMILSKYNKNFILDNANMILNEIEHKLYEDDCFLKYLDRLTFDYIK